MKTRQQMIDEAVRAVRDYDCPVFAWFARELPNGEHEIIQPVKPCVDSVRQIFRYIAEREGYRVALPLPPETER